MGKTAVKIVATICLFSLILSGCGGNDSGEEGKYEVIFAASTTTGSFYQFCIPCCEIINKYSETVKVTPITTSGTKDGFDLLAAGEVDAVGGPGIMEYYAYTGQGAWAETGKIDFSVAYVGYPDYVQVAVPEDSGIYSISDLQGKSISVDAIGNTADVTSQLIFSALDITDYTPKYLNGSDSVSAIQDGSIDVMIYCGGLGPSCLMELASSRSGMRLVSFSDAEIELIESTSEGILRSRTIPSGYYDGVDEDILTVGSSIPICVSNSLPDEVVYEMVRILDEYHAELLASIGSAEWSTPENTVNEWGNSIIPLHTGAEKYFQEIGLSW